MKHCLACKGNLYEQPLLTLDHMPASAQNIPGADDLADETSLTLNLCQCRDCGLVQFDCEPVDYYREVIRAGGFSTTMVELRRGQYRHLIETYHLEGKRFLEVGCGRGEFLSVLTEFPVMAYGIEAQEKLVALAKASGLVVWKDFAASAGAYLADPDNPDAKPPYDVFLSFNFLEHQPDPSGMLTAIYDNLADDGLGLITVPSFEYILEHDGYYELIRDHLAYYTFDSLAALLKYNGFQVLEQEIINRDTISMIVKKTIRQPGGSIEDSSTDISPIEVNSIKASPIDTSPMDVSRLRESRRRIGEEINDFLAQLAKQNQTAALWGASHQGFTLAATTELGKNVRYIIDSAPFKQGLYAPASHLPIVAPDYFETDPVDVILIAAPGYTAEIAAIIRQRFIRPERKVDILTLRSSHLEWL